MLKAFAKVLPLQMLSASIPAVQVLPQQLEGLSRLLLKNTVSHSIIASLG